MNITKIPFGVVGGKEVFQFTLKNKNDMTVQMINYGGIITSLLVPDKTGKLDDVVLGFDNLATYLTEHPYVGTLIGRYANRIAQGRFVLNGKTYRLPLNDGENHLHGGNAGFHRVVWEAAEFGDAERVGVELNYLSRDGEEGYPGNLSVTVRFLLNDQNELVIKYLATTDQPTVVNLTHHNYFNLKGEGCGDILDHEVMINADRYTVAGEGLIPTGELAPVKNTPLDFTAWQPIGARIAELSGGYDHNYVLNREGAGLTLAASVRQPKSGRIMTVYTTEPGMQFYTGNSLDGTFTGKRGVKYGKHSGFCLETQHFPDSPNHPGFPSTVLNPGEVYRQTTIYRFATI
ncbi:MAG: galactose mutarotase [Firmicutes bacterium]|nr:galactose mutarotase [Bacillota bacterium]